NPFPEEMNRRLVACVADLHFAPTPRARDNLLAENVPAEAVHLVGNTVVDALFHARDRLVPGLPPDPVTEPLLRSPRARVLVTARQRRRPGGGFGARHPVPVRAAGQRAARGRRGRGGRDGGAGRGRALRRGGAAARRRRGPRAAGQADEGLRRRARGRAHRPGPPRDARVSSAYFDKAYGGD